MNEDIIPDKVFYMDRTDTDNIKPYAYIEWFSWMVWLENSAVGCKPASDYHD